MSEISQLTLTTPRTARIALLGDFSPETTDVWLVTHGYRQLGASFVSKFRSIAAPHRVIVAPEGLSRFYIEGFSGRVGASWMTREDREYEIEDQFNYLERVYDLITQACTPVRIHLLGFSQGVATAWRWLARTGQPVHSFTVWAGGIPPEQPPALVTRLEQIPFVGVYATQDEFITEAQALELLQARQVTWPHLHILRFEGRHDLDGPTLVQLAGIAEGGK
ncbi:MAG: hypothetical protein SF053_00625 [Bacteroidia bacterium]|nr:hypothetical protein [Bacteroidia bacterium]